MRTLLGAKSAAVFVECFEADTLATCWMLVDRHPGHGEVHSLARLSHCRWRGESSFSDIMHTV